MVSSFDLAKLQEFLRDFYNLTHIRITVFDESFHELVSYPEDIAPICRLIRQDPAGEENCRICDQKACSIAAGRHDTYIYRCHAGLTEAITPIYLEGVVVGYLLFGHVFSYPHRQEGAAAVAEHCKAYSIDHAQLEKRLAEMPLLTEDYIHSASHLLLAAASYLCMERMIFLKDNDLPMRLDRYINTHLTEHLTAEVLCSRFGIGKTYLYELSRQSYGCGIAEHIRMLRIRLAQQLLRQRSELSISEVAERCGFEDYNYFITVFRRLTGTTPKQYRRRGSQA